MSDPEVLYGPSGAPPIDLGTMTVEEMCAAVSRMEPAPVTMTHLWETALRYLEAFPELDADRTEVGMLLTDGHLRVGWDHLAILVSMTLSPAEEVTP